MSIARREDAHWQKAVLATTRLMRILSFQEFFTAAAESLAQLLNADGAALIVYDGPGRLRYKLFHGLEVLNQVPIAKFSFPDSAGTVGRVLATGQPMFTSDYAGSEDAMPEFVAAGLRANLVVPLTGPSGYIGALTIVWLRHRPASPNTTHVAIAEMFAALTASALYREALETKLEDYSLTDPLTGLPNRRMLMNRLANAQRRACRNQSLMVLAVLDLDGFKAVNDEFGHACGDQRLLQAAAAIRGAVRDVDTVARLGGDEFVVILEELRTLQEVKAVLDRIVCAVRTGANSDGDMYKITASVGATIYPLDFSDPDLLLQHADKAMYLSKRSGGDRVKIIFS